MDKIFYFFLTITLFSKHLALGQSNPDRHNTSIETAWMSCDETDHPKQGLPNSHWIRYDLGYVYALGKSKIWNINHPEHLNSGVRNYAVDVSMDGTNWQLVGEYDLDKGSGSGFYLGDDGPDFDNLEARYILITVLANYGNNCAGFAEFKVDATEAQSTHSYSLNEIEFSVAPNPFSDALQLSYPDQEPDTKYEIFDITGKAIKNGKINTDKTTISTSDVQPGAYTLRIINKKGYATKKIIKH